MDRVALEVVAYLRAYLTLDRLTLRLFVAVPTMLLELVKRCHDDGLAKRTEMLRDRERPMNMRDVTVVGLDLVKGLVALLTLHFLHQAFVSDVSFPSSEFLRNFRLQSSS